MSKLYTKTGDNGLTNLYDTKASRKDALVFEVLGDLDELSAHIGVVCVVIKNMGEEENKEVKILRWIQSKLLDIGSDIATTKKRDKLIQIVEHDVQKIEQYIDDYDSKTPKLTEFILPGFSTIDSCLHVSRAVCRRLERHLWKLKFENLIETDIETFKFINRLSDFLFALARFFSGGKDIIRSFYRNL